MARENSIHIFTDGGARGNPGPAAIGVVVKDVTGKILAQFGKTLGVTTNNVAEYQAVIEGLTWMKARGKATDIVFFLDSKLVASQLSGTYKVKSAHLRDLVMRIRILEQEIGTNVSYRAIPREKNQEADRMVNLALDSKTS